MAHLRDRFYHVLASGQGLSVARGDVIVALNHSTADVRVASSSEGTRNGVAVYLSTVSLAQLAQDLSLETDVNVSSFLGGVATSSTGALCPAGTLEATEVQCREHAASLGLDFYVVASTSFTGCARTQDRDITGSDPVPSIVFSPAPFPGHGNLVEQGRYARVGRRLQTSGQTPCNSEQACRNALIQLGVQRGSVTVGCEYVFSSSSFGYKGCYRYISGTCKDKGFYGTKHDGIPVLASWTNPVLVTCDPLPPSPPFPPIDTSLNPGPCSHFHSSVYGNDACGYGHNQGQLDSPQAWSPGAVKCLRMDDHRRGHDVQRRGVRDTGTSGFFAMGHRGTCGQQS